MAIKHAFTSGKTDGGDPTEVRPSNWNDDHEGTFTAYKWLTPNDFLLGTGSPVLGVTGSWATTIQRWTHPATGVSGVTATFAVPADWASGTIKAVAYYQGAGGNTDNRQLGINWAALTPGADGMNDAIDLNENDSVPHGNGTVTAFAPPTGVTVAAGDLVRVTFARDADTDTNSDGMFFLGIRLEYTANH